LSHDLVRQTVRESLSGARRCRLHGRIARVLQDAEARGGALLPEQVIELAHHLTEASAAVEPAAALPYLLTAADDALGRLAFDQAERFLATAAEQAGQVTDVIDRTEAEREVEARAYIGRFVRPDKTETTEWTAGSRLLMSGTVLPLDRDSPAAWMGALAFLIINGDLVKAAAAAEEVDADILPLGTACVVHFERGIIHTALGLVDIADLDLIRSEDMLAQVPDGVIRGMFPLAGLPTAQRAVVAALRGDDASAEALLTQARAVPGQVPIQRSNISFWGAWCAAQAGTPVLAAQRATTCIELAAESGDTFYTPPCEVIQGWSRALLGDSRGLHQAEAAYRLSVSRGMRHLVPFMLTLRAEAHSRHGDLGAARELIRQARVIAESTCERALNSRLTSLAQQLVPIGTEHAHPA